MPRVFERQVEHTSNCSY